MDEVVAGKMAGVSTVLGDFTPGLAVGLGLLMLTELDTKEVDAGPLRSCRDLSDVLAVLSAGGFIAFELGQTEAGGGRMGTEDGLSLGAPVDCIRNEQLWPGCAGSINLQKKHKNILSNNNKKSKASQLNL